MEQGLKELLRVTALKAQKLYDATEPEAVDWADIFKPF